MKIKQHILKTTLTVAMILGLIPGTVTTVSAQMDDDTPKIEEIHSSQYYAQRAQSLEDANSWESAKREIDAGLEQYPDDPELLYLNGRYYYYAQRDLQRARYNLVKALQESDHHWGARRTLIDVEDDAQRYSSAICYINELLEQQPYDRDLWRRKIALYNKAGNAVEAEAALERLARIYPNDSIVKRDLALLHRQTWNQRLSTTTLQERATSLENWLNTEPENMDYYLELSDIYIKMGDYDKAMSAAKRGLVVQPGNTALVQRVASLMSEQGLYTRALMYLKENRVSGRAYINAMQEAANDARLRDAYDMNGRLYAQTGDRETLNYLLNTALTRGYYDDALTYLKDAYRLEGRTQNLLMKEYELQKRTGNDNQARRLLNELFTMNPYDDDLREEYIAMQLQLANIDEDERDFQGAYDKLVLAVRQMPIGNDQWVATHARMITLLGDLDKNEEAKQLYSYAATADPNNRARYASAYEDIISKEIKRLIEDERYGDALIVAEDLLETIYDSETAIRACINMSQTLRQKDKFYQYAQMGFDYFPDQPYFIVKQAVALQEQGKYQEALEILMPQKPGETYPRQQLINPYAGVTEDYSVLLIKEKHPNEALQLIESALVYDPDNTGLKYLQGIAYEQLKEYKKAYELQSKNYNPSNAEQADWLEHIRYLSYKSFKNRIDMSYTSAFYDSKSDELSTIAHMYSLANVSYTHFWKNFSVTGGLNYRATDGYNMFTLYEKGGSGVEIFGEVSFELPREWTLTGSLSGATKYFNKFGANFSFTKGLKKGWTVGGRAAYRFTQPLRLYNKNDGWSSTDKSRHLLMLGPRGEKEWDRMSLYMNADLIALDFKNFYYNAALKGKFFVKDDGITSVGATIGVGSFPEIEYFDQTTMNGITNMNAMVGIDSEILLTKNLTLSLSGAWNTYYNPKLQNDGTAVDSYRNVYSLNLGLHIMF